MNGASGRRPGRGRRIKPCIEYLCVTYKIMVLVVEGGDVATVGPGPGRDSGSLCWLKRLQPPEDLLGRCSGR